ncbi:precorrin-2 dehydrogenase/sirohydrochlorin ferrochelatase family protein [Listeria fleischmannii]|uniref:precorrin-2 dehydrogenase n=1 Tax=Listeria fleischmannii TaxID=1069827 RepID=A0A841YGM4_9LIST|nr:NAD(P)-dependent oxidoreductase [Listeria fleischmannii]EIA21088.1 siroheme synthase [Listeria fleischmannii subsp. coloradonensis]MBC1399304.1 NAD(P)-dependent oxidoreductase [Listeria fleischmannii]MBC1427762.1 NAD(P)-dependent oxidoreductase [Listeria fleischmannii]STY35752.1 Precorrin-2 dehydrogenase [Listeria fleischmannii subsp. coloradonensis]
MSYLINLSLAHKQIVVIGGGKIAKRKVEGLLKASENCQIHIVAPEIRSDFPMAQNLTFAKKVYEKKDLQKADLIFACTNDALLNATICRDKAPFQWVNDVSDKSRSDFWNVVLTEYENFQIGIASRDGNPQETLQFKQYLEEKFR